MASIHPDISDRFLSYLDRRLDEHDRRQVHEHLASCGACSDELAALRAVTVALRQAGRDSRAADAGDDRYGCPGPEELSSYESRAASHPTGEDDWIARHLEACSRCQHEVDLAHLMRRELQGAAMPVMPQDLSAEVEARLMARVRQGKDGDDRASLLTRFPSFGTRVMARVALTIGLAAAVAVWGLLHLRSGPVLVAHRPTEQEVRPVTPSVSPPSASQRELETPLGTKRASPPSVSEPASPRISSPTLALPPRQAIAPPVTEQAKEVPARPSVGPSLPPLVPAKQGEPLKALLLPTRTRPGLRSAVASQLQDQLEVVQPPDREFPAEPSVDDLTANRRLGRLFGVRYVLEIGVTQEASGYRLVLRAADTDTGGIVAKREGSASQEGELAAVAGRLARELRQQLQAIP